MDFQSHTDVMSGARPTLDAICKYRTSLQDPYACIDEKEEALALHRSENPWAIESAQEDDEFNSASEEAETKLPRARKTMSRQHFVRTCNRIFRGYSPRYQRGVLLPQHQAFVARNAGRAGDIRLRIARSLSKYDLSDRSDLRQHFNRELTDVLDDQKLRAIESDAVEKKD
jgi:hypothetical protein